MNSPSISEVANWASIVGLLISLAGLGISIWVLVTTLKLKSEFRLRIGIPRLLNKLTENASTLKELDRKFASSRRLIVEELIKIEANIHSVKEKDDKTEDSVAHVQSVIKLYRDDADDRDKLWAVEDSLLLLIEKIKNIQDDRMEER
jgi:hypothetical protein